MKNMQKLRKVRKVEQVRKKYKPKITLKKKTTEKN